MTQAGSVIGGRFEVQSLAGSGGMGSVYRAVDRVSGQVVALKLLAQSSPHRARFRREAEVLASLQHPCVVRYLGHGDGSDGEPPYIAMEWVEGVSLRERLLAGRLGVGESVALARRVADALGCAHLQGIVHRDVKPENLLLVSGSHEQVKVLDFGVALAPSPRARMTRTGTPLGTIGYMAPEQVRGETDVDARADVFALGAVLFECLTGESPFHADQPLAVLAKIVLEDAPRVRELRSDVPKELELLLARMLAKERGERPRDGNELCALLGRFDETRAVPVAAPSLRPPALTGDERVLLCAVVGDSGDLAADRTLVLEELEAQNRRRAGVTEELGGRFEPLGARSFVATFSGRGEPSAIAMRAARAALALQREAPDIALVVVAGRSSDREHLPVARAVDRAVALLSSGRETGILLDETLAALLSSRFVVHDSPGGPILGAERDAPRSHRRLLGRAAPCLGRQRELEALRATWEECRSEPIARVVLLTGPAGIGKSRIRRELGADLGDAEVWLGRGDLLRAGTPFAILADALQNAFELARPTPEQSRAALAAKVARWVPPAERGRVTAFLAELSGLPLSEEPSRELRAARQDPILMGDQIRRAFEDLVCHAARVRPLALILDDLHWGDLPSVKLVDAALRRASELPFLVLGVGRPELFSALPNPWAERDVQEVRVGPLSRKAAQELARFALPEASEAELGALVERAAGNPLYLEELARAHADGRGAAPGSVLAMVQARLDAVEPEGRRVLRAASVFGMRCWQGALETLLADLGASRVATWLSLLSERELLVPAPDTRFAGEREYAFSHDLLREAAHATLTDEDRTLGHRLAAAWLEQHGERDARLVAEHHEQGGSAGSAVPWWQRAAVAALEANDFSKALSFVARGKSAGASGPLLGALLLTESEALRWSGELEAALSALEAGLALLPIGTPRWCHGVAEQALLLQRLGRGDALPGLGRSLLGRSVRDAPSDALAFALVRTALFCLLSGHGALAEELAETAAHAERAGVDLEPGTRAQSRVFRALSALYRGDLSTYLREELAARRHFEEAGDARRALNESGSIGFAQMELGSYREAEATLMEALERAEQLGLEHVKAASWHNLGLVYARLGRFDEAKSAEERSLAIFRAQSDRRLEGAALTYLALIALLGGDCGEAERVAREALALVSRVAPPIEPLALGILAAARLALGDRVEALAHAEAAMRGVTAGASEAGEALIRLVHADALDANGRQPDAAAARAEAKRELLARAGRIEDPAARQRFLENVPENARTLAAG